MDDNQKKLAIGAAVGGGLALLYLLTRRGGGGITVSSDAAITSQLARFWENVTEALGQQQAETAALVEETATELRQEQTTALAGLQQTITGSLDALTQTVTGLTQKTANLESELEAQREALESAAQVPGDVVRQPQALLMAGNTAYLAALSAAIGTYASDPGYWSARKEQLINKLISEFSLNAYTEAPWAERFRSHAMKAFNEFSRGAYGSAGSIFTPIETGPMGTSFIAEPGISFRLDRKRPIVRGAVYGIKLYAQ